MSSEILLSAMVLMLVGCGTILWFFLDHVKKRGHPHKKIFICADCWLLVFDFLAPSQLGLGIALISRRFDFYVDEHFKTRKWRLEKQFLIQWDIEENGTKKMQIVNSDGNPLPIPQNPLPNKVIGFKRIETIYIDQNVVTFLRRFHRIFAVCSTDLYITTGNDRILDFVMLNICSMLRHSMHMIVLNTMAFRRMRQLDPSLLNHCPSLCYVLFEDAIFAEFPPDESAMASDGQAVTKWLLTPRPDGRPKWLRCTLNSPVDQWLSTMEQFKAAFSNASSPVTFRIHFLLSSPLDIVVPFDLINQVTGEKLLLLQFENAFCLTRCPIGWNGRNWKNMWDEFKARPNPIDIRIRDGGYDDGLLLDAASPGPSDH